MKASFVYLFLIAILAGAHAGAQTQMLKSAMEKINHYENISYSQTDRQKSPFTDDWTTINFKALTSHNPLPYSTELFDYTDARGYRTIYNGNIVISLDVNNKTYEISNNPGRKSFETPYHWARYIEKMLTLPATKVKIMPDTIVNQTPCFHVKRILANLPTDRNITDLYLSKSTYLPVFIKELLQGRMGKGEGVDDKITMMITEYSYDNYHINIKGLNAIATFTIPANYNPEKKVGLLAVGNQAPNWTLESLEGATVSGNQFKGKVTLLDFSFNECAACMLSIPVLNRLHEKYKGSNIEIATINTSNTKESVAKFVKKNGINYPILLKGSKVSKDFQVSAYPTFYVIDKQGSIAGVYEGYSKTLESSLITMMNKLNN